MSDMRLTIEQQAEQEARRWAMGEASSEALRRDLLGRWPDPGHCYMPLPRMVLPDPITPPPVIVPDPARRWK